MCNTDFISEILTYKKSSLFNSNFNLSKILLDNGKDVILISSQKLQLLFYEKSTHFNSNFTLSKIILDNGKDAILISSLEF